MGSMNILIAIGNLGRDAELRYTPGGAAVCKFSLATTETWNDKAGNKQERTEWFNCDLWGKAAESLAEYLKKGKQVAIRGRLQTDEYTDRDGVKRKATKVRVDQVTLLGSSGGGRGRARDDEDQPSRNDDEGGQQPGGGEVTEPLTDDDIPFVWALPWLIPAGLALHYVIGGTLV